MPFATTSDGVRLHYEEVGEGEVLVFLHEFGGDHRSWEGELRHFSRRYRCVTYSARGYLPSDVPTDPGAYSQERARDDLFAVLDHLGIAKAHLVGLSMGAFAALHAGIAHPGRVLSMVIAGCGYGADPAGGAQFRADCEGLARAFETDPALAAARHAASPTRVQLKTKNPRGWEEFARALAGHSPLGSANTLRNVLMKRPLLFEMVEALRGVQPPVLVIAGDEDEPCLEAGLLLKRTIPRAGLLFLPRSGHTLHLEEPGAFHRAIEDFHAAVHAGAWGPRRSRPGGPGVMGFGEP